LEPKIDRVISVAAKMGVPILVLIYIMGTVGATGGAAIILALTALGPGGIVGGIVTLLAISIVAGAIADVGMDRVAKAVVQHFMHSGMTCEEIIDELKEIRFIRRRMKRDLIDYVEEICTDL